MVRHRRRNFSPWRAQARGDLPTMVTFAVFVGTPGDRMFGVATGPEAEAIMCLAVRISCLQPTRLS